MQTRVQTANPSLRQILRNCSLKRVVPMLASMMAQMRATTQEVVPVLMMIAMTVTTGKS
jgi:hypothetical protein